MRLTRRPEAADVSTGQVERLREAVDILHRVMGITDRAFREAVVDGYIVLPPPLRDRVATTVSPEVHADYLARIAELTTQADRLREWAARLPEAEVAVPEPQALDPVRLLAWIRRSAAAAPAGGVPAPPAATPVPPQPPPAPAPPPPAATDPPATVSAAMREHRPLVAAGALLAVAAVAAGVAVLRPPSPPPAPATPR